jgi:quercetin dioxygenase-like cupin family protein
MSEGTRLLPNLVASCDAQLLYVLGPTIQFVSAPQSEDEAPCVLKGVIPPGISVPIHSHPGVEAFFVLSGAVEAFSDEGGKTHWIAAGSGDFIEVPSNAKHGFRNLSHQPVIQLITTTSKLGRFFQEIGRPVTEGVTMSPPTPHELKHFLETARRYGYWLATPEENAAVGIFSNEYA